MKTEVGKLVKKQGGHNESMPNYPRELEHVFTKEAGRRTPGDIAEVIRHYQTPALQLAERMTQGHESERTNQAHELALKSIAIAAQNHGPEHQKPFRQRWYNQARQRIEAMLQSPSTSEQAARDAGVAEREEAAQNAQKALDGIYRAVNGLVQDHIRTSQMNEENRMAMVLLYGEKPMTAVQVADAVEKKRQIVTQAETLLHRRIRKHAEFGELERRWHHEVLPALEQHDELNPREPVGIKRKRLERLFKR